MDSIYAFLPCRLGSERIKNKNIKSFAGFQKGLLGIKLKQLLKVPNIKKIFLSTNDEKIISFARSLKNQKLIICIRPNHLGNSFTSTDDLIKHVPEIIKSGDILWTHVTSPFINSKTYKILIEKYFESKLKGYDSLMTVNIFQSFLWNDLKPINYKRSKEKWPKTQTLNKLYEVNSAAFISNIKLYKKLNDRIGKKPYMYPLNKVQGFDIDWPEDFFIAENIFSKNPNSYF